LKVLVIRIKSWISHAKASQRARSDLPLEVCEDEFSIGILRQLEIASHRHYWESRQNNVNERRKIRITERFPISNKTEDDESCLESKVTGTCHTF